MIVVLVDLQAFHRHQCLRQPRHLPQEKSPGSYMAMVVGPLYLFPWQRIRHARGLSVVSPIVPVSILWQPLVFPVSVFRILRNYKGNLF